MFPTILDKTKSVHIETLGCRLNQLESEGAAEFFLKSGFFVTMNPVSAKDGADKNVGICVLNTCAVTTKAEQKARRTIRLLLKKFPNAILIVTGCYALLSANEISSMDERIFVLPGLAKSAISKLEFASSEFSIEGIRKICGVEVGETAIEPFRLQPQNFIYHSRASLKVQDGCNNNCSYCAIHIARGKSISIEPALAVERAKALEEAGHSEVVLTGVNLGQYSGVYNGKTINLAGLIELILAGTKKIALRLSSIYPQNVTKEFCAVIKDARVRPHFHLSVQSGSDSILRRMNRSYTRADVIEACRRLRKAKDNPFLACDIIAGFPGETENDFLQTMDLIEKAEFVYVHAFPFSPRKGTAAFLYTPKIPERIKDERVKMLNEFSSMKKIQYINSFAGKERPAVFEAVRSPGEKKLLHALTDNFIHTEILAEKNSPSPKEGSEGRIKILGALQERILAGEEWEANGCLL